MKKIFSIWMQPLYARANMGDHKVWLMVLATFPLLTMGIAVMGSYAGNNPLSAYILMMAALIGIGVVLFLLFVVWFVLLVPSVALQYSPANARLVPYLKCYSQWALAIPILLFPVVVVVVAAVASFRFDAASLSANWLLGVFVMLTFAATMRSKWVILPLVALTQIPLFLNLHPISFSSIPGSNPPILALAIGLLLSAAVLHWIFAMNPDTHIEQRKKFAVMQMAMNGNPQTVRQGIPMLVPAYFQLLKRQIVRANLRAISGEKLLPYALGPQVHWSATFLQVVAISVGISAYLFFVILRSDTATRKDEYFFMLLFFSMLACMLFAHVFVMLNAICQTRGEQGLVSLTARMPSPLMQTRILLGYLLRQFFFLWSITLIAGILINSFPASDTSMRDAIYLGCFSLLPMSVCLLKNHTKTHAPQDSLVVHILLLCVAIFCVSLALVIKLPVISAWMLCALISLSMAIILRRRWNKLLALTAVFPAGRGV